MLPRWLAALTLVLGTGCAAVRQPPITGIEVPLPEASTLAAVVEQQRNTRTSLSSVARFRYEGPDTRARARQALLVARPDRLRIELFSPLGSVFILTVAADVLAVFVREESTIYRGRATRANLRRYAQVNLDVTDAVDLLLGVPPLRPTGRGTVTADPQSDTIRLWRWINHGPHTGAQVIWFDRALHVVATEDQDIEGRTILRAEFGGFATKQFDLPTSIAIEFPIEHRRLDLQLREVEVNPKLPSELFTLGAPAGVTEVLLDDGAEAHL